MLTSGRNGPLQLAVDILFLQEDTQLLLYHCWSDRLKRLAQHCDLLVACALLVAIKMKKDTISKYSPLLVF